MPTLSPAATGSGALVAAPSVNGDGLYCSESLACSDTDVTCTDANGIHVATTSSGTLVPA